MIIIRRRRHTIASRPADVLRPVRRRAIHAHPAQRRTCRRCRPRFPGPCPAMPRRPTTLAHLQAPIPPTQLPASIRTEPRTLIPTHPCRRVERSDFVGRPGKRKGFPPDLWCGRPACAPAPQAFRAAGTAAPQSSPYSAESQKKPFAGVASEGPGRFSLVCTSLTRWGCGTPFTCGESLFLGGSAPTTPRPLPWSRVREI